MALDDREALRGADVGGVAVDEDRVDARVEPGRGSRSCASSIWLPGPRGSPGRGRTLPTSSLSPLVGERRDVVAGRAVAMRGRRSTLASRRESDAPPSEPTQVARHRGPRSIPAHAPLARSRVERAMRPRSMTRSPSTASAITTSEPTTASARGSVDETFVSGPRTSPGVATHSWPASASRAVTGVSSTRSSLPPTSL